MEGAAGMAAAKIAPKLLDFLVSNHKVRGELKHDIQYIKNEFLMICAAIREDEDRQQRSSSDQVQRTWIEMVRDLAHEIEDCIDRFTHRVTLKTDASWTRQKLHRVKTVPARNKFAAAIRRLRKRSEEASELRKKYYYSGAGTQDTGMPLEQEGSSDEETAETDTCMAVGMDAPLDELIELIREAQGQPKELKVISLVGFGGIGKTHLARHVYNSPDVVGQYQSRAWVRVMEKGAGDVLLEILVQIGMHSTIIGRDGKPGSLRKICTSLRECLGTQRFFIVIDDMPDEFWHHIKDAFPVVPGVSSRIMVTTAIRSVANACSSARGHAYVMKTLANEHSRQLFFREASLEDLPPPGDQWQLGTTEALAKCDGLPLALVSTAQFLQNGGGPENWADLCDNLGEHLETKETLARMKRVLVHSYTSLGSKQIKTCLLYMGIYPSGRPIKKGSLIRRWLAEGFIQGRPNQSAIKAAIGTFGELVNRSIIQPNDASSNKNSAEVKTCQTHGMMIEFILRKSTCENFVTLLYDEAPLHSNIRWLSLHHRGAERARMNPKDLPLVRSLTVFSKAHNSMLDFSKYELMRVLDLEECENHLEEKHLKEICKLLLLRYLSLGASAKVKVLPKEIKKLQLLETLDIRRTNIEILPTQVMELPCLIHLFGRFKLQHNVGVWRMRKLQTFLSEKSKLETVAGFVVDDKSRGFAQLLEHMKHLAKIKIWCKSTTDAGSNLTHLSEAIKGFIARGADSNSSLSLSLNFSDEWSHNMLMNLSLKEKDSSYFLSSLKLQGDKICSLPPFVTMLSGLTKLYLSSPHHRLSTDILSALSSVRHLEYLKLVATQLDKLVIEYGGFEILRHLCIVVEVMTELDIQEGALPVLESLRLLCKDQNGLCGTMIQSLICLKEVALHDGVNEETKHEWKEAAKNHPRHPKLLFVETKLMGSQPGVEIIHAATATDTTTKEVAVESELIVEVSPAATATNTTIEQVDVGSEPDVKINPSSSPTTATLSVTTLPSAICAGESVQVDGCHQHDDDDDDAKEDTDNTAKDFAKKNGASTQVMHQMSNESSIEVIKGEKCLLIKQIEDSKQKQGLHNKQRLGASWLSLVATRLFRRRSQQEQLVSQLG
uniref:Uncharacterized protein n=1 Tax=Avena sativa TaxID=4498 RepID=A0ACD5V6S8_AVESA